MSEYSDNDYRNRCSEKTLQTNSDGFFMDFVEVVKQSVGQTWIQKKFGKLKTDSERIRTVYTADETKEIVLNILSNVQEVYRKKDATVSQLKRLEAETAFEQNDLNKSLIFYSQSVMRAPGTGQCSSFDSGLSLSLALWGRCKVLMGLKQYSLALNDVQLALKERLPNVFKAEAYWKMGVCYKALREDKKSKVAFDLAEKLMDKKEKIEELEKSRKENVETAMTNMEKVLPNVEDKNNKEFPCASKKLSVKSTDQLGRFIVANESIKTGETLVVEPPYVACLLPEMFGTHCHNCFTRLQAPVACPDCSNVAFCNTICRDEALSTYHKYECKYLDLLIGSGMSVLSHSALRIITQQNLQNCLEIYKNKQKEKFFSLCTNSNKRNGEDFLQRTLMAAFLLRCLQKCGYFNTPGNNVLPTEEEFLIGEYLLFNLQMLQFNAHEIFEQLTTQDYNLKMSKLSYIGVALYPTVALFNHDCYPAVTRYFVGKYIVIKSLRPLAPNEIVAENYGPICSRKELKDRQRILSSRYWFQCECNACTYNWPQIGRGMDDLSQQIRCPTENCSNIFTLPVSSNPLNCPKCKNLVNLDERIRLLKYCEEQYKIGFNLMQSQQIDKAVGVFYEALDTFHNVSCPPHKETHLAQEALQICLASYGNVSNTLKEIK
ncbi:SET and MYND domain-containing protein 4-like [Diorhabda sublineata]|uniref:SET and MYND domain-containing protein 4-like n=1 Tax=Diorhabda sublineata TaxID=1163346 RepID=UPI0024E0C249|nr:SET and MYND domain-containing protein 4-like [Diorhabda sublineata]